MNGTGADLGFEDKLWAAADKLRANMDAAEYKHVILGLVFLKYISDAFSEKHDWLVEESSNPESEYYVKESQVRYGTAEDRDEYLADNIFWVPPEARWDYLQKNAKRPEIGKLVDDAMTAIERDNKTLKGVLPKDYARPALDKVRLGEIIDLIATIGLGDKEGTFKINVAANSWSSSIREMLPQHVVSAPHSKYVRQEEIVVRRLDSMMDELCPRSSTIFLKVDTQGFEMNVLRGAEKSLERIGLMQLEMSLVPLYRGEVLFDEMSRYLVENQYVLVSLEPGFSDPKTGRLLQVDGVFSRVEPGTGTR